MSQRSKNKSSQFHQAKPAKKSQLRIIGGQWRGRKLNIADVEGLRPSGDRIRETLFNWLAAEIPDAHCLDCFAGTGALGLESLSRGAASVELVEKHPIAATSIAEHLKTLDAHRGKLITQDCLQWLEHSTATGKPTENQPIDIAFIDPPFSANLWDSTISALENSQRLADNAIIYIESPKDTPLTIPAHWVLHREKYTGQICFRLFIRQGIPAT